MIDIELQNLTPHAMHLFDEDGTVATVLPATSSVATVTMERTLVERIAVAGWTGDIWRTQPCAVEGLPPSRPRTMLVVSRMLAEAVGAQGSQRPDLVFPLDLVRDPDGRVIGCRSLGRI